LDEPSVTVNFFLEWWDFCSNRLIGGLLWSNNLYCSGNWPLKTPILAKFLTTTPSKDNFTSFICFNNIYPVCISVESFVVSFSLSWLKIGSWFVINEIFEYSSHSWCNIFEQIVWCKDKLCAEKKEWTPQIEHTFT
jgi:hypothetical protein